MHAEEFSITDGVVNAFPSAECSRETQHSNIIWRVQKYRSVKRSFAAAYSHSTPSQ